MCDVPSSNRGHHGVPDAYIERAPGAAGTGLTADDIDECDWIVVGHSHFDHLWGAERILARTRAQLIGSYETVRLLEQAGVPLDRMICVSGGERIALGHGLFVSAYPSLHSCLWTGSHIAGAGDACIGDLGLTWQERAARMKELVSRLSTSLDGAAIEHLIAAAAGHSDRGDGGALVYLFETPEGSLLFQDTSGHWGASRRPRTPRQLAPGLLVGTRSRPDPRCVHERAAGTELLEPGYLAATPIFAGLAR